MVFLLRKNSITKRIFNVLLDKGFEGTYIHGIHRKDDVMTVNVHLPVHKEQSDLERILPNLQQEMGATAVKLGKTRGKYIEILFGMRKLEKIIFDTKLLHKDTLKVTFPSAYGQHVLDFEDGASCHLLNGGTTRMGKTCFLLYVATTIYVQNEGDVMLYISSAKLKDYYPFDDVPNVKMAKDISGVKTMLEQLLNEYKKRNNLLYSKSLRKATDAKSIRKLYPEQYFKFKPVFLIIDEYARFAKNDDIQDMVTELVETAGFVNIHVIIASQRPDATTVLKPRIRGNLLTRIAFTTADKKNSEIILDREGAENLGRIAGRGILIDSDTHIIQVPFLDVTKCDELLKPYKLERIDIDDKEAEPGRINHEVTDKIQSMLSQSDSLLELQREQQPHQRSEQSVEAYEFEWSHSTDTEGKG